MNKFPVPWRFELHTSNQNLCRWNYIDTIKFPAVKLLFNNHNHHISPHWSIKFPWILGHIGEEGTGEGVGTVLRLLDILNETNFIWSFCDYTNYSFEVWCNFFFGYSANSDTINLKFHKETPLTILVYWWHQFSFFPKSSKMVRGL